MSHLTIHKHRESSYLRAYKALHLSRTLYKSPLFMQNEPNFQKAKMNIRPFATKTYANIRLLGRRKNKPNSNPIKANLTQFQSKTNPIRTQTNPICWMPKTNVNSYTNKKTKLRLTCCFFPAGSLGSSYAGYHGHYYHN